ncbi:MAG: class I SAM-dependent methyltransferase, partial [Ginsengibacter sp.]
MPQHREIENKTYNERLFSPGIRGFFHNARFKWLQRSFKKLGITKGSILEIGCNDGRSLRYISFEPDKYTGYDADWEGGFDEAVEHYRSYPQYNFIKSNDPSSFNPGKEMFDYTLAMETLEHLPVKFLNDYLKKLSEATGSFGFYTVPNEKGLVFFFKYYSKKLFFTQREPYSAKEVWHALSGNLSKVQRRDTSHKGFDYDVLIRQFSVYFDIVETKG